MSRLLSAFLVGLEALARHPLRTALSTLGIVMGSASLTAVLALGDGAEAFARRAIEREGWNEVSLSPRTSRQVDGLSLPVESFPRFDVAEVDALSTRVAGRASIHLGVEGPGVLPMSSDRERAVLIVGRLDVPGPPPGVFSLQSGRTPTEAELRSAAPVAVIGHRLAEALREGNHPGAHVGGPLTIASQELTVVGVLAPIEGERTLLVSVPFGLAERLMLPTKAPRPRRISLRVGSVEDVPVVRTIVSDYATTRGDWAGNYVVSALGRERLDQLAQGILSFKILMGAFTAISLLVGGVGIMNVLLASILERTREIGVRKAVGARRSDVLWQFLVESMTVALAGATAGVLLGLAGAYGVTALIRTQSEMQIYAAWSWQTAFIAGVSALMIGLTAGLYPALRAARLTPLDAIVRE